MRPLSARARNLPPETTTNWIMSAHQHASTRPATRGAGSGRAPGSPAGGHHDGPERLDLDATFVIGLRELGRRAGNALPVHREGPLADLFRKTTDDEPQQPALPAAEDMRAARRRAALVVSPAVECVRPG